MTTAGILADTGRLVPCLGLFVPFKLPYQVVDGLVGLPLAVGVITRMDEVVVVEHEFHQCAFLCACE